MEDNIFLPAWAGRQPKAEDRLSYIDDVMPPVAAMAGRRASALSRGQQKMVALARALMTGTKLLLDEPFEGLAPAMGEGPADTILLLKKDGVSVLIAESDLNRITFVEEVYTIERGEIVLRSASTAAAPALMDRAS